MINNENEDSDVEKMALALIRMFDATNGDNGEDE